MDADPTTAAAIRLRNETLRRALADQDFAAAGLIYLERAVLYPHEVDDIFGRERIIKYWHHFRNVRVVFESSALMRLSDNCVQETGRLKNLQSPNQSNSVTRYLTTWSKAGGDWQIATSIFNRMAQSKRNLTTVDDLPAQDGPQAVYVPRVT